MTIFNLVSLELHIINRCNPSCICFNIFFWSICFDICVVSSMWMTMLIDRGLFANYFPFFRQKNLSILVSYLKNYMYFLIIYLWNFVFLNIIIWPQFWKCLLKAKTKITLLLFLFNIYSITRYLKWYFFSCRRDLSEINLIRNIWWN